MSEGSWTSTGPPGRPSTARPSSATASRKRARTSDPRERRPRLLDDGRGPEVRARFLEAVAELGRAVEGRPGGPVEVQLPSDIQSDLQEIGYVGDDE